MASALRIRLPGSDASIQHQRGIGRARDRKMKLLFTLRQAKRLSDAAKTQRRGLLFCVTLIYTQV
ncbi:hypothetical protein [Comamonas sp. JUb58]|uniref:hypothetical protein n=1 Tax=Comamonas sp. JUb58 TaxID=2485114 RepID=UPI00105FB5C9|nr:hypothetical protein [Comamonas sp. JUb58]